MYVSEYPIFFQIEPSLDLLIVFYLKTTNDVEQKICSLASKNKQESNICFLDMHFIVQKCSDGLLKFLDLIGCTHEQ